MQHGYVIDVVKIPLNSVLAVRVGYLLAEKLPL